VTIVNRANRFFAVADCPRRRRERIFAEVQPRKRLVLFLGSRWTESPRCRRRRRREKRRDSLSRYQRQWCQQIAAGRFGFQRIVSYLMRLSMRRALVHFTVFFLLSSATSWLAPPSRAGTVGVAKSRRRRCSLINFPNWAFHRTTNCMCAHQIVLTKMYAFAKRGYKTCTKRRNNIDRN